MFLQESRQGDIYILVFPSLDYITNLRTGENKVNATLPAKSFHFDRKLYL